MSGFAFRDRTLKLTIAGNDFGIEVDAENGKIVKSISEEAVGVVKAYQSDNKTEKEAIASFKGFINQVLSDKKASSKIFAAHTGHKGLHGCTYVYRQRDREFQSEISAYRRCGIKLTTGEGVCAAKSFEDAFLSLKRAMVYKAFLKEAIALSFSVLLSL